jgi:hypothetical protein
MRRACFATAWVALIGCAGVAGCASEDDPSSSNTSGTGASTSSSSGGDGGTGDAASSSSGDAGSGGGAEQGGAGGGGGDVGPGGSGGGSAECDGFTVSVAALRAESIARLESFFGASDDFDTGALWFNEGMAAYDGCPAYPPFDYSSVVYVAPIAPALVPPEIGQRKVGVSWGLNGVPDIWLVPADDPPGNLFYGGRSPVSGIIALESAVTDAEASALFASMNAAHPNAKLQLLSSVGMLIYAFGDGELDGNEPTGLYTEVLALLDDARNASEVAYIEPDGFVFPIPYDFAAPVPIARTTDDLAPECLRDLTLPFAGMFQGAASFPPPFGAGWMNDPTPCQ